MSELVTLYQRCDHPLETHESWASGFECASSREFQVPANRLVDYHVVRIDDNRYHLTHPITCADFPDCAFEVTASRWDERPVPRGTYRWLGEAEEMKLARVDDDE